MTELGARRPVAVPAPPATSAICPYLIASEGGWRGAVASRGHRCAAVTPAAVLALDKQRRLCLVAEHAGCSTYAAASGSLSGSMPAADRIRPTTRPLARTTPVILDRARLSIARGWRVPPRGVGQGSLVALMAVAFGALVVTRLAGGGPDLRPSVVDAAASPSPGASAAPARSSSPAASSAPTPERTLVPSESGPTPAPSDAAPRSTPAATSYKVKRGDTLSGIAGAFGTTWQVLAELNGITDPGRLKVGQVLQLP